MSTAHAQLHRMSAAGSVVGGCPRSGPRTLPTSATRANSAMPAEFQLCPSFCMVLCSCCRVEAGGRLGTKGGTGGWRRAAAGGGPCKVALVGCSYVRGLSRHAAHHQYPPGRPGGCVGCCHPTSRLPRRPGAAEGKDHASDAKNWLRSIDENSNDTCEMPVGGQGLGKAPRNPDPLYSALPSTIETSTPPVASAAAWGSAFRGSRTRQPPPRLQPPR